MSDPLAVVSELSVIKHWYSTFILSAVLPVVLTLMFGRVFCSWVCPMGLLSEAVTWMRRRLERLGLHAFAFEVSNLLKYVVLVVGLGFGLLFSVRFFFWIYPPRIVSDLMRDFTVGEVSRPAVAFLIVILVLELLFVRRLWCRCLCPGGALYALLGRWRFVRIERDSDRCTACLDCDAACPHELTPSRQILGGECDNCGLCRASCDVSALHYAVSRPGKGKLG